MLHKKLSESREPLYIDVEPPVYARSSVPDGDRNDTSKWMVRLTLAVSTIFFITAYGLLAYSHSCEDKTEGAALLGDNAYSDQFIAFTKKYNKEYESAEATMKAFKAYEKHMKDVEKFNGEHSSKGMSFGENEMADWTDDQFKNTLLPMDFYKRLHKEADFIRSDPPTVERGPIPDHFDWRAHNVVTPVKAQGQCGSCWAFAATATVEAAWKIAHPNDERILSEQTLLDCDMSNNACNGGDEDKAFRFIHREGLAYLDDYPYVAHRQNNCLADGFKNRTKIEVAYFINPDERSMINWLVNFGPVNIGMSVIQPMRAWKEGVFHPSEYACKNEVIGLHAMLIVGFGTSEKGEKYWIIKNSWGSSFGVEGGYIYYARGVNACFVEDEPVGILA